MKGMQNKEKVVDSSRVWMDYADIMNRYNVGRDKARAIIRGIQNFTGNTLLGPGRVLVNDVIYWENNVSCGRSKET